LSSGVGGVEGGDGTRGGVAGDRAGLGGEGLRAAGGAGRRKEEVGFVLGTKPAFLMRLRYER